MAGSSSGNGADEAPVADNSEEIEAYKKRIENLEGFKKLFFEMESKWETAKGQAEEYHEQLMAVGLQLGGGESFEKLLNDYSANFDELGGIIVSGGDSVTPVNGDTIEIDGRTPSVGKMVIANQEEMQRLKNMAVDQHKVITELKRKLIDASTPEQQAQVADELTGQLEQQERFIKETETCTKLLEGELERTAQENEQPRKDLNGTDSAEETEKLQQMVGDFTAESQDMLKTIGAMEEENQALKTQLESGAGGDAANVDVLKDKLGGVQQELLNLQTQHIELEERYLELKMKG